MTDLDVATKNWLDAKRAVEDAVLDGRPTYRLWALAIAANHLAEASAIMAHHTSDKEA